MQGWIIDGSKPASSDVVVSLAKRFKVVIIPEGGRKVRQFRLSRWGLVFSVLVCVAVLGLAAFFIQGHRQRTADLAELQRLRVENGQQRHDLLRLSSDLADIRQEMVFLAESEARLRQLASLGEPPQPLPVAIGGLPEPDDETAMSATQQRIAQLQLAIELRRQSQETIRNLLNDQVSLGRATPQGWPVKGWLTSYFGKRQSPISGRRRLHEGLDIAASIGTPVTAAADGVVARVEYSPSYGKMVVVDHGYGYQTLYAHNSRNLVKRGERVHRGDKIAEVGNTGRSTGPHLHYEIHMNGVPVDPRNSL